MTGPPTPVAHHYASALPRSGVWASRLHSRLARSAQRWQPAGRGSWLFFPDGDIGPTRAQVKEAKQVCRRCPVTLTCLSWALDNGQEAGIWGGTTEQVRRLLRRRYYPPRTSSRAVAASTSLSFRYQG